MKEELLKQLYLTASKRAKRNDFQFDQRVDSELKNFLRQGINRMTNEQLRSELITHQAENNIIELVDLMTQDAQSRLLTESLDISALTISLKGFCPRFPFC